MTIYSTIEELLPNIGGWCSIKKAQHLVSLLHAVRPEVSVEIGVYAGKSAIPMAMMHRALQHGKLYAIDSWAPAPSVVDQAPADKAFWGNPETHRIAENNFRKMCNGLGLEQFVEIVKADSNDYTPPPNIGVLHIDGNHGPQTIRDVERFAPNVKAGGFCVLDDLCWSNDGPANSVQALEKLGFVEVVRVARNFTEHTDQKDDYGVWQSVL